MIVVLMGVTGSGKTTVGRLLAKELGWEFHDADQYHPAANVEKMRRGIPLSDEDRKPWLETLAKLVKDAQDQGRNIILACSALKHRYQEALSHDRDAVHFVCLCGTPEVIRKRLEARTGHFMSPALLPSQFAILEMPENAIKVDVSATPEEIARDIRHTLGLQLNQNQVKSLFSFS